MAERQAGAEFQGVALPEGMTVECARELAHIVHEHERANHYDEDGAPSTVDTAVKAFQVVARHLR